MLSRRSWGGVWADGEGMGAGGAGQVGHRCRAAEGRGARILAAMEAGAYFLLLPSSSSSGCQEERRRGVCRHAEQREVDGGGRREKGGTGG